MSNPIKLTCPKCDKEDSFSFGIPSRCTEWLCTEWLCTCGNRNPIPAWVNEKVTAEPKVADSVEATLAQRGSRYGDFTDHARLCQNLMGQMQLFEKPLQGQENLKDGDRVCIKPWEHLSPVQRQALTVIADKIARILSGDPNYDDNWHDIQGYAKLVEDRLPKGVNAETTRQRIESEIQSDTGGF